MVTQFIFYTYIFRKVSIPEKNSFYNVKIKAGKLCCDCLESVYEGLPCRHELCIYIKETRPLNELGIHERWTLNYFTRRNLGVEQEEQETSDEEEEEDEECLSDISEEEESKENQVSLQNFFH